MKKIIYTLITCLPFLGFGQNEIPVETNFDGMHCRGDRGVCSFTPPPVEGRTTNSTLLYDADQGLILKIYTNRLTTEQTVKAIGESITSQSKIKDLELAVEADFNLDPMLLKKLNMPDNDFVIKEGNYPITYKDDMFLVVFKL